jgi:hypothetical protein
LDFSGGKIVKLKTKIFGLLVAISLIGTVYADARNFSIKVHNTEINVRAPDGFYESSYIDPLVSEIFSKLMPDDLRIHAILIPKDGMDDDSRYMVLVTVKEVEKLKLSQRMFDKEIRKIMREQQFTLMNSLKDEINDLFIEKSNTFSNDYDMNISLKTNEMTSLGVFLDNSDSIGFATIMNMEVSAEEYSDKSPIINATVFSKVKNKLIVIYIYSEYRSMKDVVWVKAKAKEFTSLLLINN